MSEQNENKISWENFKQNLEQQERNYSIKELNKFLSSKVTNTVTADEKILILGNYIEFPEDKTAEEVKQELQKKAQFSNLVCQEYLALFFQGLKDRAIAELKAQKKK